MSNENTLDLIREQLSNSEFIATTKSKGQSGISIVFNPLTIMDVRGGNLDLPPGLFLRLDSNIVKYHFDPKIFDSAVGDSYNENYNAKAKKIREDIDKAVKESSTKNLDADWQILRLLDPRLLFYDNFEILKTKETENMSEIQIQYNITNFLEQYCPKIDTNMLYDIPKTNFENRIATIYIDDDKNLKKIKQQELFSKDIITILYNSPAYGIKNEIVATI